MVMPTLAPIHADKRPKLPSTWTASSRALPAQGLDDFVSSLARRIAQFSTAGLVARKERVNAIALAPVEDFRRDSDLFGEGARNAEAQSRFQAAFKGGFQTRLTDGIELFDDPLPVVRADAYGVAFARRSQYSVNPMERGVGSCPKKTGVVGFSKPLLFGLVPPTCR
jgi:hypothetical protein